MIMIKEVQKLNVKYNEKLVGYLMVLDNLDIAFQYDDDWIQNGFSISPLSLPLSRKIYINPKKNFNGLYGAFWDSLPDGWGALLQNRFLASIGINPNKISPLTKLSIRSSNGLGALSYEPIQLVSDDYTDYTLDDIAKNISLILADIPNADLDKLYKLAGSSGGARPKVHIKHENESWIVKFPSSYDTKNISKNEYHTNLLAKKCDIEVNEFKLFESKICDGYFGAKRFDRINGKPVHMISLSAILETSHQTPNLDYLHLLQVINQICIDKNDLIKAFKLMCFNVLYGNRDDHGKNFAFLYDENLKGYKLSPAFDLTQTLYKTEHEMTVAGKRRPKEKDILEVAKLAKLPMTQYKNILRNIKEILENEEN